MPRRLPALLLLLAACGDPESVSTLEPPTSILREFEGIAEALESGSNSFLGGGRIASLEQRLGRENLKEERRAVLWPRLVRAYLGEGDVHAAREEALRALEWAGSDPARAAQAAEFRRLLALCELRRAEVENCLARPTPNCCLFPLAGDGVHTEQEPARAALEEYLAYLELRPTSLEGRWLANLTAMALGEHPDAVPEPHRIAPSVFDSESELKPFPNVAAELGVDALSLCGGVAVADFDLDGHLDIVTSSYGPRTPLVFYRGGPGLSFQDVSAGSGLEEQLGGLNLIHGDYDGDGDPDLFVLRGAWLYDDGAIRNSLLRNEGDGTFTDVTREAGIDRAAPTQAACFGDFDGDGLLDLFVANESRLEIGPPVGDFPAELWINQGDGTFVDQARQAGVTNDRYAKGVSAGDHDGDGDLDLYVSNVGANRLYQNEGDGSFRDVAPEVGVTGPEGRSFAPWFFDYDQDGHLDLFVAAFESTLSDIAAGYLGLPHQGVPPRLYRNLGDGRFEDVAAEVGLDRPLLPMGANFGDLDGDGWLDLLLATGEPSFEMLCPNVALRNDGGRRFLDVTTAGGFGHLQKGHGVAFADLDGDGDQDIYNQLGGFFPGDAFRNALFENPGHGHRFVQIELVGTKSNRDAIGARLRIVVETGQGETRELYRHVGSVSSFGGSPLRQDEGLGDARGNVRVEVRWPAGTEQVFDGIRLDARVRLIEGTEEAESLEVR